MESKNIETPYISIPSEWSASSVVNYLNNKFIEMETNFRIQSDQTYSSIPNEWSTSEIIDRLTSEYKQMKGWIAITDDGRGSKESIIAEVSISKVLYEVNIKEGNSYSVLLEVELPIHVSTVNHAGYYCSGTVRLKPDQVYKTKEALLEDCLNAFKVKVVPLQGEDI